MWNKTNLYIDYSTCVVEAVRSSPFFRLIRPRITGLDPAPTLFGLQGTLGFVNVGNDRNRINQELNNIHEISYANIQGACQQICNSNEQAILITDGEFWTEGMGERTDLAYMKDSFIKWLSKGFEIYIYIEPYRERYNGVNYDKKRFYFLFTSDDFPNNIYQELNNAFNGNSIPSNVKLVKISNSDLQVKDMFTLNVNLSTTY